MEQSSRQLMVVITGYLKIAELRILCIQSISQIQIPAGLWVTVGKLRQLMVEIAGYLKIAEYRMFGISLFRRFKYWLGCGMLWKNPQDN